ncbi:hypothetical protein, partial [Ligilactobacillus salivarius]|uniref:hypothetical protein n=1 Tax=Ligilactobacillus salivarius TaxID=1624 RepID=UPI0031E66E94
SNSITDIFSFIIKSFSYIIVGHEDSKMLGQIYLHVTQKAKNNLKVNLIFYSLPPNYPPFAYFFNNFTIHYIKE